MVDIIVGNKDQNNQLLVNNGDGSYSKAVDLPGGAMNTVSIAVADVNGDGMADIIIGNYGGTGAGEVALNIDTCTQPRTQDVGERNTPLIAYLITLNTLITLDCL